MVTLAPVVTAYPASLPFEGRWMKRSGELALPSIRRVEAADLPIRLGPISLVHVSSGALVLRGASGAHRLLAGELLTVRSGEEVELDRLGRMGEALVLHADPHWVERARALFGASTSSGSEADLAREPAGTEASRRTAKLLLAAHLERTDAPLVPERAEGLFEVGGAGRVIELVGIALALRGSLEAARAHPGARMRSRRAQLVRALEALESAPLDNLSLRVLAERLEVSERQASRLLREELGTSFPDYLTSLRIERAKKLLATTDEPVTGVALETGWQSISHFNSVFRRRVGTTPTLYRARHSGPRLARAAN